jgi:hypothetical protein
VASVGEDLGLTEEAIAGAQEAAAEAQADEDFVPYAELVAEVIENRIALVAQPHGKAA